MCVFDYADKSDMDFIYKKISNFLMYRYPTVSLQVGKYTIDLPLNWRILVCNDYDYVCQLVPVEDLLHFPHTTAIFNPFYVNIPKIVDIKIKGINPHPIDHFVPRLPKHNLLVLPLGNKNDWETKVYDRWTQEEHIYPDCLYACDDIDTSKFEVDLSELTG